MVISWTIFNSSFPPPSQKTPGLYQPQSQLSWWDGPASECPLFLNPPTYHHMQKYYLYLLTSSTFIPAVHAGTCMCWPLLHPYHLWKCDVMRALPSESLVLCFSDFDLTSILPAPHHKVLHQSSVLPLLSLTCSIFWEFLPWDITVVVDMSGVQSKG